MKRKICLLIMLLVSINGIMFSAEEQKKGEISI